MALASHTIGTGFCRALAPDIEHAEDSDVRNDRPSLPLWDAWRRMVTPADIRGHRMGHPADGIGALHGSVLVGGYRHWTCERTGIIAWYPYHDYVDVLIALHRDYRDISGLDQITLVEEILL